MPPGRRRPFSSFMPTCMPLCVSWAGPAGFDFFQRFPGSALRKQPAIVPPYALTTFCPGRLCLKQILPCPVRQIAPAFLVCRQRLS